MVIHPVDERKWEDANWDCQGHRTCINMEVGTFCRLLYLGMVTVGGRREATHS
jgi:hypothetical protein